jgi:hypothetical protein
LGSYDGINRVDGQMAMVEVPNLNLHWELTSWMDQGEGFFHLHKVIIIGFYYLLFS